MNTVKLRLPPRPTPRGRTKRASSSRRSPLPPIELEARPVDVRPGNVIAGRYRVETILGRSRGILCTAVHIAFDRQIALRVIAPALADPRSIDRFHREARIMSELESDHIARIHDFGTLDDGSIYLVREYLDGMSLAEHARARRGLPLSEAVLLFLQVCEALQEAHARDVVLRDLQPSQVILTRRKSGVAVAKITDVGTCKVMRRDATRELSSTQLFDVSPYGAPELLDGRNRVDERADIWSLGCLLYELISGRPAFQGEGMDLSVAIARENPPPLSILMPEVPRELDAIVGWALAKDPERRFRSVHALAHELRRFACARGQLLADQIAILHHGASEQIEDDEDALTMVRSVGSRGLAPPPLPRVLITPVASRLPSLPPLPAPLPAPRMPSAPTLQPRAALDSSELPWLQSQSARVHTSAAVWAALIALPLIALLLLLAVAPAPSARVFVGMAPTIEAPDAARSVASPRTATPRDVVQTPQSAVPSKNQAADKAKDKAADKATDKSSDNSAHDEDNQAPAKFLGQKSERRAAANRPTSDHGTLAAMAVGASCSFAVDGTPVGVGTNVRARLPVGRHRVTCKRASGTTRSMSVTIEPGRAAVALFRF